MFYNSPSENQLTNTKSQCYNSQNVCSTRRQPKGAKQMTNNERELINIIRENEKPEQALLTAVLIIGAVLEQSLSSREPFADSQRGLA